MPMRTDNRVADELRDTDIMPHFQLHPAGSVLISMGQTRVICAATVYAGVPSWMKQKKVPGGWLTAEYQMLPGATAPRASRELSKGKPSGRSSEIQRLIGRSLRMAMDLTKIPGITINIDCDVLDADGGTRCAAITGACVALELACQKLFLAGDISQWPLRCRVAAVSVGMVAGEALLDLCYKEDVAADVDMNVVMTSKDEFVEIQGTAENKAFTQDETDVMLGLARKGIKELLAVQNDILVAGAATTGAAS